MRLLLLMATRTYRARAFIRAAHKLGGEVLVGTERRQALSGRARGGGPTLDFSHPERATDAIVDYAREHPLDAVVGVDDDTTLVAAMASAVLGLPGNTPESVQATQNKFRMRELLGRTAIPLPQFQLISIEGDPKALAQHAPYPCVLKPVFLSASRGVIRANTPNEFVGAFQRITAILHDPEVAAQGGEWATKILVESFVPGFEVALEGLLSKGQLQVLAMFDKPDPLDGPFFEETIYLTPSRLDVAQQTQAVEATIRASQALGLRDGPVHAELRINAAGAWLIEIAARSIGGLCSSVLEFSAGLSLEDLILRHALGADTSSFTREPQPAGVMMVPIPRAGILREVRGKEAATEIAGIESVEISISIGQGVMPLPEGSRYLGFIFARGATIEAVEDSLRRAHRGLDIVID